MIARFVISMVCMSLAIVPFAGGHGAWAEAPRTAAYSLPDILGLAVQHNPTLAGAEGYVKQSQGQQIAAGAYPNPSITGIAGRGAIRDPSTGTHVTERTFTVEQPLEWTGKRQARQEAADAGLAGANAALDDARLSLLADVKIAFYHLLFGQRDIELAAQNVTNVEEVLRTVQARVAAGEAFDVVVLASDALAKLRPAFKKDGTVTAGNASGINDGAAAIVLMTADHGCDPTWRGTDHTRERVPIMCFGPGVRSRNIGIRNTYADIGETIAAHLGIAPGRHGRSFL